MAAGGTLVHVTAHRGGAAAFDSAERFQVQPGEPGRRMIDQSVTRRGYNIGQLQEWPLHSLLM